jgi:hypothetical protein
MTRAFANPNMVAPVLRERRRDRAARNPREDQTDANLVREARRLVNLQRYQRRYARHPASPAKKLKPQRVVRLPTSVGPLREQPVPMQSRSPIQLEKNIFDPRTLFTLLAMAARPGRIGRQMPKPQRPAHQGKAEMARRAKRGQ